MGLWEVIIKLARLMWTIWRAKVSHANNLHLPSTAQAIAVIGDSVIDIFDSGGGMGDFQDINGVSAVNCTMVNLKENDALVMSQLLAVLGSSYKTLLLVA